MPKNYAYIRDGLQTVIAHDFIDNFLFYSFLNELLVTYLQLHSIRYHTSKTFQNTTLILGD